MTGRTATRVVGSVLINIVVLLIPVSMASAAAVIEVHPSSASPGDTFTIAGTVPTDGCPASDAAELTSTSELFPPDGFGPQATRDAAGRFTTTYQLPASIPVGTYSIGVRCGGGNVGISADLHVVAATAAIMSVSPSPASPGDSVTIAGTVPTTGPSACPVSDPAQLTSTSELFPPDGFGPQAARAASGKFTTDYVLPASTPLGDYRLGVRCGGGNVDIGVTLHVRQGTTSTSSSTSTRSTPSTTASSSSTSAAKSSSSSLPWILLAIAVVVAGLIAVFFLRRRRA